MRKNKFKSCSKIFSLPTGQFFFVLYFILFLFILFFFFCTPDPLHALLVILHPQMSFLIQPAFHQVSTADKDSSLLPGMMTVTSCSTRPLVHSLLAYCSLLAPSTSAVAYMSPFSYLTISLTLK